jgi:hypothetical protein
MANPWLKIAISKHKIEKIFFKKSSEFFIFLIKEPGSGSAYRTVDRLTYTFPTRNKTIGLPK